MKRIAPKLVRLGMDINHWDCDDLTTSLLLLQFDGIVPVVDESGDGGLMSRVSDVSKSMTRLSLNTML